MSFHVRWMIRRDLPEVLATEEASYPEPWGEKEFLSLMRQRQCIGMVCEVADKVIGHLVYALDGKSRVLLLNLAVAPEWRRQGAGSKLLVRVRGCVGTNHVKCVKRNRVVATIPETDLAAHLFLRSGGFKAEKVVRRYFGPDEDGYRFVYRAACESTVNAEGG